MSSSSDVQPTPPSTVSHDPTLSMSSAVVDRDLAYAVGWVGMAGAMAHLAAGWALATLLSGSPIWPLVWLNVALQSIGFATMMVSGIHSERVYDIVGAMSFILLAFTSGFRLSTLLAWTMSLWHLNPLLARQLLVNGMLVLWAVRLAVFLTIRTWPAGKQSRFEAAHGSLPALLQFWSGQALWVFCVGLPVYLLNLHARELAGKSEAVALRWTDIIGGALWLVGFTLELVADIQKEQHQRAVTQGRARGQTEFICTGLWAISRHPNYLGEILMWLGIALLVAPVLSAAGYEWEALACFLAPGFTIVSLTMIPGMGIQQEAECDRRWGHLAEWREYKKHTPQLMPKFQPFATHTRHTAEQATRAGEYKTENVHQE